MERTSKGGQKKPESWFNSSFAAKKNHCQRKTSAYKCSLVTGQDLDDSDAILASLDWDDKEMPVSKGRDTSERRDSLRTEEHRDSGCSSGKIGSAQKTCHKSPHGKESKSSGVPSSCHARYNSAGSLGEHGEKEKKTFHTAQSTDPGQGDGRSGGLGKYSSDSHHSDWKADTQSDVEDWEVGVYTQTRSLQQGLAHVSIGCEEQAGLFSSFVEDVDHVDAGHAGILNGVCTHFKVLKASAYMCSDDDMFADSADEGLIPDTGRANKTNEILPGDVDGDLFEDDGEDDLLAQVGYVDIGANAAVSCIEVKEMQCCDTEERNGRDEVDRLCLQNTFRQDGNLLSPIPPCGSGSKLQESRNCHVCTPPRSLLTSPHRTPHKFSPKSTGKITYSSTPKLKRTHGQESPTNRPKKAPRNFIACEATSDHSLPLKTDRVPAEDVGLPGRHTNLVTVVLESPEPSSKTPQPKARSPLETPLLSKPISEAPAAAPAQAWPPSVTPAGAGLGLSLKDRLKLQLQRNAGLAETPRALDLARELRERTVAQARLEAEQIRQQGTEVDIGPFYGLPSKVKQLLQEQRKIENLYDWQDECLRLPEVRDRKNLIYSLPTSGGKTLVAEILILRELLCHRRDAMLVLPFVAIVQEKVRVIGQLAAALDFLVEEYAGSKGRFPPIKRQHRKSLYVATIEKAHSLVNSLVETQRLSQLGLVVVDELHMLGEGGSRGACLESTLLKLVHAGSNTQIIGMSATLSNVADLQHFLDAHIYSRNFRPVELTEFVKTEDNIYRVVGSSLAPEDMLQHERVITYQYTKDMQKLDVDHILGLALEVIPHNSCLIFCPTKKNCENVALMLAKLINRYRRHFRDIKQEERESLVKQMKEDGGGEMCPVLAYTLPLGIAYHHGGLTMDERRLLEDAYSEGLLCLLACTSTLAAGVNLPAKRVIVRSPYVGKDFLSPSQYKQMTGRAGRAGIDSSGESILITQYRDRDKVLGLLSGPVDSCLSSLMYGEGKGMRHLILSVVGLQMVTAPEDLVQMMQKSLLWRQAERLQCDVKVAVQQALQQLVDAQLVKQVRITGQDGGTAVKLEVTALGKATFKGSVDLDYSPQLYQDLRQAEHSLVLVTHLHLLYLVTPYDTASNFSPSWLIYFQQMGKLDPVEMQVASLIGVTEQYITLMAAGKRIRKPCDENVARRFYWTLMLYELWKQKSVWEVAEVFQVPRGFLQNLLTGAASFAACVFHFAKEMDELWAFQDLLGNFVKRLSYCVTTDLLPLMEIPGIKVGRARQLHAAGYRSLQAVAHADPKSLVRCVEHLSRKAANQIVASAQVLLAEKAEALMEEVEELVRLPDP